MSLRLEHISARLLILDTAATRPSTQGQAPLEQPYFSSDLKPGSGRTVASTTASYPAIAVLQRGAAARAWSSGCHGPCQRL